MISVLNYGAGNLQSVRNTLDSIGAKYELTKSPEGLHNASKIILPGVGHFGQITHALDDLGVREALLERIRAGVPFLGICLGLQALFTASEEAPGQQGLALFEGTVAKFQGGLRIPHMGWDQIEPCKPSRLLQGLDRAPYFYFAHSYYCPLIPASAATCDYMVRYTAVLEQDNVFGVQFHPEKSGALGQIVIRNFVEL